MKKIRIILALFISLGLAACAGSGIKTKNPNLPDNAFLDGGNSKVGVVLCHGRGHYPTWLVVDPLRKGIHKQLGYHTLSIQMPTGSVNWRKYADFFPDAYTRIQAAIDVLRKEKGVETIYLMGHSMGTRMATAFIEKFPDAGVAGFIGVGTRNGGNYPLDSDENLRGISIPVLDVYGDGGDGKDAQHANRRSDMVSARYTQVLIPGANHKFTQHDKEMVDAVVKWLRKQEG